MRASKREVGSDTTKVLLVYDEVTEGTHFYLIDATTKQLEVLKAVHGCYVNSDDITDAQLDMLSQKVLPALDEQYSGEDAKESWKGIWKKSKIDVDSPKKLPACSLYLVGFLP